MIQNFRDKDLAVFWLSQGQKSVKCVPSELRKATYQKLLMLDQARSLGDLAIFPSNNLEKLKSKSHLDCWSIRINIRYRLIFIWKNSQVWEVEINKHNKRSY